MYEAFPPLLGGGQNFNEDEMLRVIAVPIASVMAMAQTPIACFGPVSANYLAEITVLFKLHAELKPWL